MGILNILGFLVGCAMFLGGLFAKSAGWVICGAGVAFGSVLLGADWSSA